MESILKKINLWGFLVRKKPVIKLHENNILLREKGAIHKMTTEIVLNYDLIGIEDLSIRGMVKNSKLSRSIMDQGFYEICRHLEYKAKWYGSDVVVVDGWFPSSKMCSECGKIEDDLTLSDRTYICEWGNTIARDLNVSKNI